MRKFLLKDRRDPFSLGLNITCKNDKDCIFCKHCDCHWDFTHGPYLFLCDLDRPECNAAKSAEEHTCELFEDALIGGEPNA